MSNTYYTTDGPVRGCCGHAHRTEEAAEACLDRDSRACHRQGGYSDRSVKRLVDGKILPLVDDDEQLEAAWHSRDTSQDDYDW